MTQMYVEIAPETLDSLRDEPRLFEWLKEGAINKFKRDNQINF